MNGESISGSIRRGVSGVVESSPQTRQARIPYTPCFIAGTEIATRRGPVCIEDLCVGDRILTRDNGYRPIRWIGARQFDTVALADYPELQPVRIPAGTLGDGRPACDIVVSPQHRMLLTGALALSLGGESEILIAAAELIHLGIAEPAALDAVVYVHIMFDAHEIVSANGCWSESFHPEASALDGLHLAQRREILAIFPELATADGQAAYALARSAFVPAVRAPVAVAA
ncbi:MAG: hypothetical protein B7Z02_09585 [Rhodobacterales bacterium 32-67-9]|nr:MAG: hypothetical protein B7Z02_09585 [Rhodobacterales bacterium 32-67-9]